MTDFVGFHAAAEVEQGAGPAAHSKRNVFEEACFVGDVFEQVFEAAHGPGEEAVVGGVLGEVFVVHGLPGGGEGDFAFFVAVGGTGVAHEEDGAFGGEEVEVVGGEVEALGFFDAGVNEQLEEGGVAGVGFFGVAEAVGGLEGEGEFGGGEDFGEGAEDGALDDFFGGVYEEDTAFVEPAEKGFDGSDAAGERFGTAWHAAPVLEPFKEEVDFVGADFAERVVGREVFGEQAHITEKGFEGVRRTALIVEEDFPGVDGGDEGGMGGEVGCVDRRGCFGRW